MRERKIVLEVINKKEHQLKFKFNDNCDTNQYDIFSQIKVQIKKKM